MFELIKKLILIKNINYSKSDGEYVFNIHTFKYGNIYLVILRKNKLKSYIYASPTEEFKYATIYYQFKRNRDDTVMALIRRLVLGHNFDIKENEDVLKDIDNLTIAVEKKYIKYG
jgi:hypothetical protein